MHYERLSKTHDMKLLPHLGLALEVLGPPLDVALQVASCALNLWET